MSVDSGAQHSLHSTRPQRPDMSGLRPPNSPVGRFFWRWKIWVGGTFVTSMLEPWETFVLLSFFVMFIFLLVGGTYRYLPSQATFLARRAHYYFVGTDSDDTGSSSSLSAKEL